MGLKPFRLPNKVLNSRMFGLSNLSRAHSSKCSSFVTSSQVAGRRVTVAFGARIAFTKGKLVPFLAKISCHKSFLRSRSV